MKKHIFLCVIVLLALFSCKDEMEKTVFIPDEDDPNLPAYTEWGYNSFGAEYERDYFIVSNKIVPCKIVYNNHQLQFSLHGKSYSGRDMTLLFVFPLTIQMSDYKDLVRLDGVKIDLSENDCTVKMMQDHKETTLEVSEGTLHFKRAQILRIDDAVNRTILSGIFDVRFMENGFPATISNGRFDMGITNSVFSGQ